MIPKADPPAVDELEQIRRVLDERVPLRDGEVKSLSQRVSDELADYFNVLDEVSKAYDSITMGRFSKPNTLAIHIINCVQELEQRAVDEAVKEVEAETPRSPPWQDIATAPKDGTDILAHGVLGAVVLRWSDYAGEEGRPAWTDGEYTYSPTHWMPLPSPPLPAPRSRADEYELSCW